MGSDFEHQQIHNEVQVIAEFGDVSDGTSYVEHGMAREIMRLREENKALSLRVLSGSLEDRSVIHQLQDANLRHQEVNDRLRRIIAALREPSEAVVKAVKECIYEELGIEYWDGKTRRIMYYAVEAAEQEGA